MREYIGSDNLLVLVFGAMEGGFWMQHFGVLSFVFENEGFISSRFH